MNLDNVGQRSPATRLIFSSIDQDVLDMSVLSGDNFRAFDTVNQIFVGKKWSKIRVNCSSLCPLVFYLL